MDHWKHAAVFLTVAAARAATCAPLDFNAPETGRLCFFSGCKAGEIVSTIAGEKSGPSCAGEGSTILAFYLAHPTMPPGPERDLMETQLRLRAGARSMEEALRSCHTTPSGQRVRILELSVARSGLMRVAPLDGSPPYWVSRFDLTRP